MALYFAESYIEQYGDTMAERLQQKYDREKIGRTIVAISRFKIECLTNKTQRSIYDLGERYVIKSSFYPNGCYEREMSLKK